MDTHQNMSDSGMLNAFLDGELDSAHEETFFRTLANDSDLRTEMHDQLAIRKAIQHDAEAYTPPAAATSAVFGALGFSIPPTIGTASATGRFLGRAGIDRTRMRSLPMGEAYAAGTDEVSWALDRRVELAWE